MTCTIVPQRSHKNETWVSLPGFEGFYEVSNKGRVRGVDRVASFRGRWGDATAKMPGKILKPSVTKGGYYYVSLSKNSKKRKFFVHRLVMLAFFGDSDLQINHKDGDKSNNNMGNLEYCTAQENLLHCTRVLKKRTGENSPTSKLTQEQVNNIREDGRLLREIAADYGVTLQAIHLIKKRKNWAHT